MDKKSYLQPPRWGSADNRLGDSCCSNNSSQWVLNDSSNDKYTAAIELSNKCREFYNSRLEAANGMRSKWCEDTVRQGNNNNNNIDNSFSISSSSLSAGVNDNGNVNRNRQERHRVDKAMETLRTEMMSLIDQDLSLMKQLLTLNETIEELKWQRQYCSYSTSWTSFSASKNLDSNISVSDTEMYDAEDDLVAAHNTSCNSLQIAQKTGSMWRKVKNNRKSSRDFQNRSVDSINNETDAKVSGHDPVPATRTANFQQIYPESPIVISVSNSRFTHIASGPISNRHERGENSFDSGIHEVLSGEELTCSSYS